MFPDSLWCLVGGLTNLQQHSEALKRDKNLENVHHILYECKQLENTNLQMLVNPKETIMLK